MFAMLGKRKRETRVLAKSVTNTEPPPGVSISNTKSSHNIFRRHFEATFAPLPEQQEKKQVHSSKDIDLDEESEPESGSNSDAGSEVSEWSGLSEPNTQQHATVEVVSHATAEEQDDNTRELHRARQKAFMSSRPPRETNSTNSGAKPAKPADTDDDPNEKLNLKHDLDLQRLLKESHLLEQSRASMVPGRGRQLALDMRLQALGAKDSIYTQRTMPRAQRVGMNKKAESRDTVRRREAKENGIVLERAAGSKKKKATGTERRIRGVDVPGVGKFSGGTLKLSRMDIANIQGTRSGPAVRRGRRGKRLY